MFSFRLKTLLSVPEKMRRATIIGGTATCLFILLFAFQRSPNDAINYEGPTVMLRHLNQRSDVGFDVKFEGDGHFESSRGTLRNASGRHIVLYTSYRSGSSFTGELFLQNPKIHYSFEPFKLLSLEPNAYARNEFLQAHFAQYSIDAFNCDYSRIYNDSRLLFPNADKLRKTWTRRIFEQTVKRTPEAKDLESIEAQCKQHDIRVLKIIRGNHINTVLPLMLNYNINVVILIRDPRAVVISRTEIEAEKAKKTLRQYIHSDPEVEKSILANTKSECSRLSQLITFLKDAPKMFYFGKLHRVFGIVRYEDIAFNPLYMSQQIYRFLDLTYPDEVRDWVIDSTKSNAKEKGLDYTYSTKRNSRVTAEKWRTKIPYSLALKMQDECTDVLTYLGYQLVSSNSQLNDLQRSLVVEPSEFMHFRIH